jgi:hypothetical protein
LTVDTCVSCAFAARDAALHTAILLISGATDRKAAKTSRHPDAVAPEVGGFYWQQRSKVNQPKSALGGFARLWHENPRENVGVFGSRRCDSDVKSASQGGETLREAIVSAARWGTAQMTKQCTWRDPK